MKLRKNDNRGREEEERPKKKNFKDDNRIRMRIN